MQEIKQTGEFFADALTVDALYAQVIRGSYKWLRMSVRNGKLRIVAPKNMSERSIRNFLQQKSDWVQIALQSSRKSSPYAGDMRDGGVVFLYGNRLTLRVDVTIQKTVINHLCPTELVVASPTKKPEDIREAVVLFLKERYVDLYNERAPQIIAKVREKPSKVLLSNAKKSRWGVCNSRSRVIRLAWRVVCLPMYCFDYLLVHELAHLEQPNHSKDFWSVVERYCPDYERSRKILKSTYPDLLV